MLMLDGALSWSAYLGVQKRSQYVGDWDELELGDLEAAPAKLPWHS